MNKEIGNTEYLGGCQMKKENIIYENFIEELKKLLSGESNNSKNQYHFSKPDRLLRLRA